MKRAIVRMLTAALIIDFLGVSLWAAPVPVDPTVVEITGHRERFDIPGVDAIQRYLLIDVSPVDVRPVDEMGNEGDGIPDIEPVAVLLLFVGGRGTLFLQPGQRNTGSTNFLARTRYDFAAEGYIVALADAASDFLDLLDGLLGHRVQDKPRSDEYLQDLQALIDDLRTSFPGKPLWVVGTSRGTVSAARAAAELGPPPGGPDGVVLTASLTGPSGAGDLTDVDLESVQVPTLIVTHQDDECFVTKPEDSIRLKRRLIASPRVQVRIFKGGSTPLTNSCNPLAGHGFFGIEQKVIRAIGKWIQHNQP